MSGRTEINIESKWSYIQDALDVFYFNSWCVKTWKDSLKKIFKINQNNFEFLKAHERLNISKYK